MQVINRPALKALEVFLNTPSQATLHRLSPIPCLYHLANLHWNQDKMFSHELLVAFEWIRKRVEEVLHNSIIYDGPLQFQVSPNVIVDGGWKKV